MTGDRVVGLVAALAAGFLLGQWSSGREALGQGHQSPPVTLAKPRCELPPLPATPKATRLWARNYVAQDGGVILK